jgi:RND family efflux transporter MFP subunit
MSKADESEPKALEGALETPAHAVEALDPLASVLPGQSGRRRTWLTLGALSLLLATLFLAGYLPRRERLLRLAQQRTRPPEQSAPVGLAKPKPVDRKQGLSLPTTLSAHEQTVIYARADGYVRRWLVDLGDQVKAHQLLAELDTPELDRALEQARAGLVQREAALSLARAAHAYSESDLARYQQLTNRKLSTRQELEQHQAAARVDAAKVQVAEAEQSAEAANVRRLLQLKSFASVLAPFAGTITQRSIERGSLVSAGTGSPLFEIASVSPLRAIVHVPQSLLSGVQKGLAGKLVLPEYPGNGFAAAVTRSAGRLDPKTRTLQVELEVDNAEGRLLPGMFGSVVLALESSHDVFVVPATAVLSSKEGTRLAVVGPEGKVKLVEVVIERDRGAEVEIASGLTGNEDLITNPAPGLTEGATVRPRG